MANRARRHRASYGVTAMRRGELARLIDEAMLCELCGESGRPNDPVQDHIILDKGSWSHRLHSNSCKQQWLALHPRKFHEGEKATVIRHWSSGHLDKYLVRKWRTVPVLNPYDGPLVWINTIPSRCRVWDGQCHGQIDVMYITIEHDDAVLYDSRWDVPCDMAEWERGARVAEENRRRWEPETGGRQKVF
jgi:hypothetical protein